jgi:hypothetical protein
MRTLRSWSLVLLAVPSTACHRNIPSLEPTLGSAPAHRFEFRPPEDSVLTESVNLSLAHEASPGVQEAEMTTTSRFSAEPDGWLLTQRVTRAHASSEDAPVKTLVQEVLQRAPLQVRLSSDGTFVGLAEPGAALEALHAVAPAGVDVASLELLFAPESLEARARTEWEVKYGGVYGRSLVQGQHGYAVGSVALGGHEVTYLLERTFSGWRLTEYGEVLVFTLRCLGAPGEKAPAAQLETLHRAGDPTLTPGVECEGEQLLGEGRFLPVRRGFTLRAKRDGDTWTWATRSALESSRAPQEETR